MKSEQLVEPPCRTPLVEEKDASPSKLRDSFSEFPIALRNLSPQPFAANIVWPGQFYYVKITNI